MKKAIFFDLDGTLLPMDEKEFTKTYFSLLCRKLSPYGYEPKTLLKAIESGLSSMIRNDGKNTNEDVFWKMFNSFYDSDRRKDNDLFLSFYQNEFRKCQVATRENPYVKEIISYSHEVAEHVILSTNPIFPKEGQKTRLSFLGLSLSDFDFVSDYSNSSSCKPNPEYFKAILEQFHLKPEEVLLFGNDFEEDGNCASSLGITVYLVDGCLLHKEKAKKEYPVIPMKDVTTIIRKEFCL